jgi:threonine/homoserine/homoserine lactone efflux protein
MQWGAFLVACIALAITPGPGVAYVVGRTVERGRAAGLASVLGVALGNLGNGIGAALGLALLFSEAPAAYDVLRYAGGAYLGFLAASALRPAQRRADAPAASETRVVRDGFLVALLNPKTALFFAAFLPRFTGGTASAATCALLAAVFVAIAAATDTGWVLVAARALPFLETDRARVLARWGPALVYLALAIFALLG